MTLAALKTKLQTLTGTAIGEVFFDWQKFLNETRTKTYPCILWSLGGSNFIDDKRTSTIQKDKTLTITVFAIAHFNINDDKIAAWDTLEGQFDTYINKVNEMTNLQVINIGKIKGDYVPEGMISADQEIGIMFTDVELKMTCS